MYFVVWQSSWNGDSIIRVWDRNLSLKKELSFFVQLSYSSFMIWSRCFYGLRSFHPKKVNSPKNDHMFNQYCRCFFMFMLFCFFFFFLVFYSELYVCVSLKMHDIWLCFRAYRCHPRPNMNNDCGERILWTGLWTFLHRPNGTLTHILLFHSLLHLPFLFVRASKQRRCYKYTKKTI